MSRPTALSVAEALEVVRAKSARWASTFDPADGTVLCRRREYARRADGTIVGLSLGRAVARTVEVRRPVVEVAAELQAQATAAARRVADLAVARAEQAARWRAQAASLRLQADAAEADLPGLEHLPGAVRDAALALDALACRVPPIKISALAEAEARAPGGAARLRARRRVDAALERRGPIPLLLREVVASLEVPGLGLLQPGAAVAVDAALAGYPFGAGPHACTGARLGRAFAEAAALVFADLGLEVARPPGRRKRRRLVVSLPELIVRRRA